MCERDIESENAEEEMDKIFEVIDKTGRAIYISGERWSHIVSEHAELANYPEYIRETLEQPLFINQGNNDAEVKYYHRRYKEKETYLIVVVKYLNGAGYVISCHYSKKTKP